MYSTGCWPFLYRMKKSIKTVSVVAEKCAIMGCVVIESLVSGARLGGREL